MLGDLQGALATAELVTLGDALNYQAANAKSAKVTLFPLAMWNAADVAWSQETLISRDVILSEHRSAVKATRSKRDIIERLKNSSSIKAERVDDALDELEDVSQLSHTQSVNADVVSRPRNTKPFSHNDCRTSHLRCNRPSVRTRGTLMKMSSPLSSITLARRYFTNDKC